MRLTLPSLLACTALALPFCLAPLSAALADPVTLTHAQGELVIEAPVAKVLILDPSALDIAAALGAEPAGVLGTNLPPYLQQFAADSYPKVGTIFEPDYEAIAASGADLMIIGSRTAPSYPQMSQLLPTVDLSPDRTHLTSVRENIVKVGQIFGKNEEAAALVASLDEKLARLKPLAQTAGTALILVVNGDKLGAYGASSRLGWIHNELGFATVEENFDDRFHGGDVISFEYILERDPDWIFVVDRSAAVGEDGGAAAVLDNALMAETSAVKNGHLVYLNPQAAYITFSGYTAVTTLLDQISAALSADATATPAAAE
ncbi:siderophore ABC transporter substrate-binding protein [Xinfangfangia sp. D13-10-4-6]|uniref:siderophore ABC transporter substrate-binding protein n=1 Tax=Pseudogemmobacter hezensis TaxID=2737662 RepID=UPI0015580017|nr:siderophore ABC transporter substrate-binding protein [Pseudogemmobacter hezensis]NPD14763.1 siderophore ABC transporter substrate-binding protein [Pseudogemmobacter hezensis]